MNVRKSSRKKQSTDESPCSSTSYSITGKTSFEDHDDYSGDDHSVSDDDDSDIDKLQYKLELLKLNYFEKKLEDAVLTRCIEVEKVSKFMNNILSEKKAKNSCTEQQKRTIIELYEKNRELCTRLKNVAKKNKNTTKEVFQLYSRLEDLMEERKAVWDEAVKVHKLNLGDSSAFLKFDDSDTLNESNLKKKEKEHLLRGFDYAVFTKSFQIIRIARILYNLICNSKVPWMKNKTLLEVLECTSKLFDRNFDMKNRAEFIETVDEVLLRLNKVEL